MGLKNQEHFTASAGPGHWHLFANFTCLLSDSCHEYANPSASREGEGGAS